MAIIPRTVKRMKDDLGMRGDSKGTVYDVRIAYKDSHGKWKNYCKRGFLTRDEATVHEGEMTKALKMEGRRPKPAAMSKITLRDYGEKWLENIHRQKLKPNTVEGYTRNLRKYVFPNIGSIPIRELCAEDLDNLYDKLESGKLFEDGAGLADNSIKYIHRTISTMLRKACRGRDAIIEHNPAFEVERAFRSKAKTPTPYSFAEVRCLLEVGKGTLWDLINILSCVYGMRISEILGLRWCDFNLDEGYFWVIEQASRGMATIDLKEDASNRILPVIEPLRIALQEHRTRQTATAPDDFVVCNVDGSIITRVALSARFRVLLIRNDMRHIRFHDTRHTAATNMYLLTGDVYTIGQILGQSTNKVTALNRIAVRDEGITTETYILGSLEKKAEVLVIYAKHLGLM